MRVYPRLKEKLATVTANKVHRSKIASSRLTVGEEKTRNGIFSTLRTAAKLARLGILTRSPYVRPRAERGIGWSRIWWLSFGAAPPNVPGRTR
jgi:hypothetical protein